MGLVERVKAILLTPQKEWPVIEAESTSVASLYTGFIMPLAAIPAVASLIGLSMIGVSVLGTSLRMPIGSVVARVLVQ